MTSKYQVDHMSMPVGMPGPLAVFILGPGVGKQESSALQPFSSLPRCCPSS